MNTQSSFPKIQDCLDKLGNEFWMVEVIEYKDMSNYYELLDKNWKISAAKSQGKWVSTLWQKETKKDGYKTRYIWNPVCYGNYEKCKKMYEKLK